jgi:MarR family transcriptional regulator, organic hydroperoxide resistance regulator
MAKAKRLPATTEGRAQRLIKATPVNEGAAYLIRMAYLALRRLLQKDLAAHQVTIGVWYYLWALWEKDGLNQRELSERTGIKEANTTVVLRMMERDGLVRRARSASDRRNVKIFITAKGRKLKDEIAHCGVRGNLAAMTGFSEREVRQVQALLKRMIRNVEAARRT